MIWGIPIIVVSDINFGTLKLGTSSNPVEAYIENRDGGADLEIYGYSYDENSPFEIVSGFEETLDKGIPIVIEPNGKPVTFKVVYTPQTVDSEEQEICYFKNNANDETDPNSVWTGDATNIRTGYYRLGTGVNAGLKMPIGCRMMLH